ncbi:MAG: glutamine-hydrolyzing carbamoyl-phosphate synthase small subunit, partial [Flavobacteriales bacterium]
QIVTMTSVHIGNYGTHPDEVESDTVKIAGLVCRNFSVFASRYGSNISSLQQYLEKDGVVGICNIDTRALVRHIREKGAMNAIISSDVLKVDELKKKLKTVPSMDGLELSSKVCTKEAYLVGDPNSDTRVSVVDYGVKKNIVRCLVERGAYVKVFPMQASLDEILAFEPHGIMLSNGPGDPSAMPDSVKLIQSILKTNIPVFGICLGHQLLALALGLKTQKMHNGHRGINHPVKNLITGKCEVTSQNHGFVVSRESIDANKDVELTHVHLNDNSVAGLQMKNKKVFSVQYHPEASPGPHDSRYLFDTFLENIREHRKVAVKA